MVNKKSNDKEEGNGFSKYPRHDVVRALRIPKAILEQNAGKECTDKESAKFVGVGWTGSYRVEISSAIKYGFLGRPKAGSISITERARQALRPQKPSDEIEAYREAVLDAPEISAVYKHYRGEYLPDRTFFDNALKDKFGIPADKTSEFLSIFTASLEAAKLLEKTGDKIKILDLSRSLSPEVGQEQIKELGNEVTIDSDDTCFVMMPFASPVGDYYQSLYEPAIKKAGLNPVRADADIFGTGKIMDQIWRGINDSKVLVAVLTGRNPNVFYELGLAHALQKPVVLVSADEGDVPFDLQHIRVIYYNLNDPFWGEKLIDKVAENILSAIKDPEEAVLRKALQ